MTTYHPQATCPRGAERGAALVVSLILLLIMTIVGVAAMNGARLEVSMAGMMQREEVALRAAERTLAVAERYTEDVIGDNPDYSTPGVYLQGEGPDVSKTDWSDIESLGKSEEGELSELGERDVFVVEPLRSEEGDGTFPLPAPVASELSDVGSYDSSGGGGKCDSVFAYRITTRSETDGNAVRIVESIYTTWPEAEKLTCEGGQLAP